MLSKSDKKSENEVDELIERFNLQGLSEAEKETLFSMSKDHTLVTMSASAMSNFAFQKTLIYQNWMILSKLIDIANK